MKFLQDMPQLQALSVSSVQTEEGWKYVAGLKELKYLRLVDCQIRRGRQHLDALKKLETLVVASEHVSNEFFDELPRLPSLTLLVFETPLSQDLPDSLLAKLQELSQLRSVVLKSQPHRDVVYQKLQSLFPEMQAPPPLSKKQVVQFLYLFVIGTGLAFSSSVTTNLSDQFSHPAARVIPNFGLPHIIVATILWITLAVYQVLFLRQFQVEFSAALAISLFYPGLDCAMLWLESKRAIDPAVPFNTIIMLFLSKLKPLIFFTVMLDTFASYFGYERILRGELPVVANSLIAFGACMPILAVREVLKLPTRLYEGREIMPRPVTASPQKDIVQSVPGNLPNGDSPHKQHVAIGVAGFDRLMAKRPKIARSRLWIAGNQLSGKQAAVVTVIAGAAGWLCIFLAPAFGFSVWKSIDDIWIIPVLFCLFFDYCAIGMAIHWSKRRSFWQIEVLRPHSRAEFMHQIAVAVARDFCPIFLCQFLATIALMLSCLRFHPALDWMTGVLLWLVLRATTYYTLALFALIIRDRVFTTIVCGCCLAFIMYAGARLLDFTTEYVSPIEPQVAGLVVVALGFVALRRYCLIAEVT